MPKGRVKLSKSHSLLGMIIGAMFLILGFTIAVPTGDKFGILLTFAAALFIIFYAYNFFSNRGVTLFDVDVGLREGLFGEKEDFDRKLRKLAKLKEDGLISQEEFECKRREILKERW